MQFEVVFSREAQDHLLELEQYLADRFYALTAERYIRRLVKACSAVALAPYQGTRREDLGSGIRQKGFEHRVTIYFHLNQDQVVILGIYYGGRGKH